MLADTLAGLAAARETGAVGPFLRAAWFLHDITEDEALDLDATLLAEIEQRSRAPEARAFDAIRRMTEYWRTWASLASDGRRSFLEETGRAAEAIGDVRGLVQVEWDSAVLSLERDDFAGAVQALERARELSASAHFLREEAVTLQILADFALQRGELDSAHASLAESAELVDGTGLVDAEIRQAHLALRLASAEGAADEVVALTASLEALRGRSDVRQREYAAVRQQLFAAELQRIGMERGLDEARARTRLLIAGAFAVSLLLLALLATFGRRRLAHTNRRLREEMQRAEGEGRARVELEQRMRLLERAESLGLIASGVAHDFNNLLAGVLGSAELLRLRHKDSTSAKHLDCIADSVERGARLCRQLQTYAGGEPTAFEPVELRALLGALEPALRAAAGTGRELMLEPVPAALTTAVDRSQLEQALLNLVANARDARARHIRVRARRERRTAEDWHGEFHRGEARTGEYLMLEVEDDGEGLSPELLERIFDPFFTTRFPGRGLGLAVVLGAVRRHHGVIAVT
ncbi:MAG: ATP-binding protein, partial [Planctomycetota bacterium]